MTSDPIHNFTIDPKQFGADLANATMSKIADRIAPLILGDNAAGLAWHREITSNTALHPVIAAMGSAVIVPALEEGIAHTNGLSNRSTYEIRSAAIHEISTHLAHAILPEIPSTMQDREAVKTALKEIAGIFSLSTEAELLTAINPALQKVIYPIPQPSKSAKPRISPRDPITPTDITPDERNRILSTITSLEVMNEKMVKITFNYEKVSARGYSDKGYLSEELRGKLSPILSDIAGASVDYTQHSNLPSIYYDLSPALSSALSISDMVEKIVKEVQHAQSAQGRGIG